MQTAPSCISELGRFATNRCVPTLTLILFLFAFVSLFILRSSFEKKKRSVFVFSPSLLLSTSSASLPSDFVLPSSRLFPHIPSVPYSSIMMSIRSGKMCLLATVCLFVFCSNVAAHGAVHARSSSGAHHQSRSFASAPAKRMHRLRRRFPPMPKPAGTFGAATSDAENLQLLKAFSDELSVINSAVSALLYHL